MRMLLILSITLRLDTMQVDYVSAFCQAPIKEDVYIEMPQGWQTLNHIRIIENFKKDHILKLRRSLYGLCQSPRIFFLFLKGDLQAVGFTQSKLDHYLLEGLLKSLMAVR